MTVLRNLPAHMTSAVLMIIGTLILLQMTETISEQLNSLYIQISKTEYCLYDGEAFDRVAGPDFKKKSSHSWKDFTADTTGGNVLTDIEYTTSLLVNNSGDCDLGTAASDTVHTPQGTELKSNSSKKLVPQKTLYQGHAEWEQLSRGWVARSANHFLNPRENKAIKFLLANMLGLGMPIGLMMTVGTIGRIFVYQATSGSGGFDNIIGNLVILLVMVLLVVAVFGVLTGSIQEAFDTIDPKRFAMYDNALGRIAATASGFWAIMFIAGLLPIAFSLFLSKTGEKAGGG